jgi:hypothetical protein
MWVRSGSARLPWKCDEHGNGIWVGELWTETQSEDIRLVIREVLSIGSRKEIDGRTVFLESVVI